MRKLTQAERRIVELLAHGGAPKRNCASSLCFLRHSSDGILKIYGQTFWCTLHAELLLKNQYTSIYRGSAVSKIEAVASRKASIGVVHEQFYISANCHAVGHEREWCSQTLRKKCCGKMAVDL